jgi:kinesin family protein 3/17
LEQELSKGKEDRAALESKLKVLEEKVLHGTNSNNAILLEKARQQEQELANAQLRLQEKKNLDEERQRKIAELEVSLVHCADLSKSLDCLNTQKETRL